MMGTHSRYLPIAFGAWLLVLPASSEAQSGGSYDLSWNRIASGGVVSATGGVYSMGGTAGQPEAGLHSGGLYVLEAGFWNTSGAPVDVGPSSEGVVPIAFRLHLAQPSPFVERTTIAFDLPRAESARLDIFNPAGERVRTLVDGNMHAGRHEIVWPATGGDGRRLAQGVYLLRLQAGNDVATGKVILAR